MVWIVFPQNPGTIDVLLNPLIGSIAEAAYMAGFDRNSDIVFAASYAPLLNVSNELDYEV